ncbi:MAG TPA: nitroreductase family protein [Spirochaetia bacterium]|nr:nitroreductase family protein [Spirochaetia bacterium]
MEFAELVSRCRSYRRFDGQHAISAEILRALVSLARCAPSAANRQPLRFVLSCEASTNARIFETLAWAAYLKEWPGPEPKERPTGYIVILLDRTISQGADTDVGIVAQTMLLGATALGLGGCMFGAIRREELAARLGLPERFSIPLVLAIGKPVERVVLEGLPADGSIRYYRDAEATHHVPKRSVEELIQAVYS